MSPRLLYLLHENDCLLAPFPEVAPFQKNLTAAAVGQLARIRAEWLAAGGAGMMQTGRLLAAPPAVTGRG